MSVHKNQLLPHNVIALIASKADMRTRARMRALDRQSARDPRLHQVVERSYLAGTGRYQRLWNQLPKRLAQIPRIMTRSFNYNYGTITKFLDLNDALRVVRREYVAAARKKKKYMVATVPGLSLPNSDTVHVFALESIVKIVDDKIVPGRLMNRETFMDRVLSAVKKHVDDARRQIDLSNSRAVQETRVRAKNVRRNMYGEGLVYANANERRNARLQRRARRRA